MKVSGLNGTVCKTSKKQIYDQDKGASWLPGFESLLDFSMFLSTGMKLQAAVSSKDP